MTYDTTDPATFLTGVIVQSKADVYDFNAEPGAMLVSARTSNEQSGLREVFWPSDGPAVTDQMSCATWTSQSGVLAQQGAALRIITKGATTTAITVTKNIWLGGFWIFNFHEWGKHGALIGAVDLSKTFRRGDTNKSLPLPWHICARAIGRTIDFKAWLSSEPEPKWGNRNHGGSVKCDPDYVYAGKAGWYIGHLLPGTSATFSDLTTSKTG